jgi:hypothetical protein
VLAVHPNSKFYAYRRCGPRGTYTSRSFPRYTCTAPVHGNPMQEIKEPDWKVLRRVHPLALERFCERVLAEIDRVSRDGAKGHHARYLQIFRIIQQRDREIARLFDNPRRSHALTMLAQIRSQGLLTEDEFSSLSPETRGAIQMLLGAG